MIFWNFDSPITFIFCFIWNGAEYFKISLGKFGPYVLGMALGSKCKKIK